MASCVFGVRVASVFGVFSIALITAITACRRNFKIS